ncbi:hypothetical protein [Paraliomyxa miuraensis]|uniref:hypothetical protein n=1 Tax=Paraliomyxa miuraensis TaxID=376150 RepID=UPI00224FC51C|nr:hypothetical protein [Paraliomyxa miuraensis]MCX4243183.1 hypothetical protein [Paraliomyxa miuraensis]
MVRRPPQRTAGVGALCLCACLPGSPPSSLLTEDYEVIGLSMEVVEPGPLSTDLLPIPADRVRSEALPGDRIRLTALVANEDGVLDLEPLEPRWLLTSVPYFDVAVRPPTGPCDPTKPLLGDTSCDAGSGASIEITVQDLAPDRVFYRQETSVYFVVGVSISTEECIDRLTTDASRLSWDCLVGRRRINLGPSPRIVEIMLEQGILLDDTGYLPLELPPVPFDLAPNFAPRISWITLTAPGEAHLVWPGERAQLPAGAAFHLTTAREGRDYQDHLALRPSGFAVRSEFVVHRWHTTADVLEDAGKRLRVPDEEGSSFTMIITATDDRESQTWSIFDFDVVSP